MTERAKGIVALLAADIEAMTADTRGQQPDSLGRRYGYYKLECPTGCGWWLRVEYQAHDDTPHPYSWPYTIDTAEGRVWTDSLRYKLAEEVAVGIAEMTSQHKDICVSDGHGGEASSGEQSLPSAAGSEAWDAVWKQAEKLITGR